MTETASTVGRIIDKYGGGKSALIQILLDIQGEFSWLPLEGMLEVSKRLDVPMTRIYHIGTFYKAFSLVPKGRHTVRVCMGTACHVRGAPTLLDRVKDMLQIEPGHTSKDMKFTLETVNCLGCCALGPVIVVDGEYHGKPTAADLQRIFEQCA
jgi:NADH-quinone oxidoreductase subunit E